MKENIDGEALLWAASRLMQQPAELRILFVLSDGAPMDDSTLAVNPSDYLTEHLESVLKSLSAKIKIYALGLGQDISVYYPNAISVDHAGDLGVKFFKLLKKDPDFVRLLRADGEDEEEDD